MRATVINGTQKGSVAFLIKTSTKKSRFKIGDNRAILPEAKDTPCSCYSWNLSYVDVRSAPSGLFYQRREAATCGKNCSTVFSKNESFHSFLFNQ